MTKDKLDGIEPKIYARRWWILIPLCLTLLGVMIANSSLNLALPSMSRDLHITQSQMTWVVNIYTLVFASLLLVSGTIADRYGRKKIMQIGLGLFILGSFYAGFFASTYLELLISRFVMGLGGAFVMPTTLSVINNVFPSKERPKAIAIWSAVSGIGMIFGMIISGVLLEAFNWNALFNFSGILAVIGFIFNQTLVHETKDEKQSPVDWFGGLLSAVSIFGIIYTITQTPTVGFFDPSVLSVFIVGAISLICFIIWQNKSKYPVLDMKLFLKREFSISVIVLILVFFSMVGILFTMTQVMQLVLGYSPLTAALHSILFMLPMFLTPVVPKIVDRIGTKNTVFTGLTLSALGFFTIIFWKADTTYLNIFISMVMIISGIAFSMTPGTNILMSSVPRNRSGMGSSMNDVTREFGGALGVAVLGSILSSVYSDKISPLINELKFMPEQVQSMVSGSLAQALAISHKFDGSSISIAIRESAKNSFISGVNQLAIYAAIIIFTAALIAFFGLPAHKKYSKNKSQS